MMGVDSTSRSSSEHDRAAGLTASDRAGRGGDGTVYDSERRVVAPLTSRADALSTPVMFVPLERLLGDAGGVLKICTGEQAAARDVSPVTHSISTRPKGGHLLSIRAAMLNGGFSVAHGEILT